MTTTEGFTPITGEELDRWIGALLSSEYKQGYGRLRDGGGYCCLGVKCHVDGFDLDGFSVQWQTTWAETGGILEEISAEGYVGVIPAPLSGLTRLTRAALADANDQGLGFEVIAAALVEHRQALLEGLDLGLQTFYDEESGEPVGLQFFIHDQEGAA